MLNQELHSSGSGTRIMILLWTQMLLGGAPATEAVPLSSPERNVVATMPGAPLDGSATILFTDVTEQAGLLLRHGYRNGANSDARMVAAGVGAGDFDGDGLVDLYAISGDIGENFLFRNQGDGTFKSVGHSSGVDLPGTLGSGPLFADLDGDGRQDLFVGGIEGSPLKLFRNRGDGTFEDITSQSGITGVENTFSAAAGDYDRDGDLDLFLTHWTQIDKPVRDRIHLWRNQGNGKFDPVSDSDAGLTAYEEEDLSFTPNFADINHDGWPDLLVTGDFGTSQIFLNRKDGTFIRTTTDVINDQNGMGAAVADYDNDGDLDWFVSSIFDPEPVFVVPRTGNRLYRNRGDGTFEEVSSAAGVREGFWGWGSCFSDFNNDGNLDLFHTNGFMEKPLATGSGLCPSKDCGPGSDPDPLVGTFTNDPSRLFISRGDGTFREMSAEWGLVDTGQGRGVVCFDYDRDGDQDIFVVNNGAPARLYRNDGGNRNHFLNLRLNRKSAAVPAVGARIYLTAAGKTQMREWHIGSNFVSQQPQEEHFGLGQAAVAEELKIIWPSGEVEAYQNVIANQFLTLGSAGTPPQTLGHREVFPHVPVGGGVEASFIFINTNHGSSVGGKLDFFDPDGNPRSVTAEGFGTDSTFFLGDDFIPVGGSRVLAVSSNGPLSVGMAVFNSTLPVEAIYRFQFEASHIGVSSSPPQRFATIPILTAGGFDTGLAISNPGNTPLSIRLSLKDEDGTLLEIAEPAELNPLPARGSLARFLTELGFARIAERPNGTIELQVTQGDRFSALALVSGRGTLSTTLVVPGASGQSLPEWFQGTFTGSWTDGSGGGSGSAALLVGVIESSHRIALSLELSAFAFGFAEPSAIHFFGNFNDDGFSAETESQRFGHVTITVSSSGVMTITAPDVTAPGIKTLTISGTAFPDRIEAESTITLPDGSTTTGTLSLSHTGN